MNKSDSKEFWEYAISPPGYLWNTMTIEGSITTVLHTRFGLYQDQKSINYVVLYAFGVIMFK